MVEVFCLINEMRAQRPGLTSSARRCALRRRGRSADKTEPGVFVCGQRLGSIAGRLDVEVELRNHILGVFLHPQLLPTGLSSFV